MQADRRLLEDDCRLAKAQSVHSIHLINNNILDIYLEVGIRVEDLEHL